VVTEVGSSPIATATGGADAAVNFEVKIQLKEPPATIRPGFSCSADILTGQAPKVLAVPIQALVVREKPQPEGEAKPAAGVKPVEEEGVYLFDEKAKTVKFQPVSTGMTGETMVEVTAGLEAGQTIVTGPFKTLREIEDGGKARLEEPKKDAKKKK